MTPQQRALAQAYEALGCALAAFERARLHLKSVELNTSYLTKATQKASLMQTIVGTEIMKRVKSQ